MDTIDFPRFILAFLLVIGLIGLLAVFFRRYGQQARTLLGVKESGGRLDILETRYVDPKHRLVLVRRDGVAHLLLLGDGHSLVVESDIPVTLAAQERKDAA